MLAYRENKFEFEGISVHFIEHGSGKPILLLHGSGPGASTLGNWRTVLEPLAERYHVFAMDLIGFGLSGKRPSQPYFDVHFWLRQCRAMIDRIPGEQVGLVGHSLSGALALKLAATEPRITEVITTGTMGADFAVNEGTRRCWTFPNDVSDLVATAQMLIYDRRHITQAYLDNRVKTLFGDTAYREYFTEMFDGDRQRFVTESLITADELARITMPVSMLHGREDVAFPPELTLSLASALPQADITLLGRCSHSIALEYPEKLLEACFALFGA